MHRLMNVKHLFVGLMTVLVLGGCASTNTVESRKQERYAAYQALSPEMKTAVDQSRVQAGMSMDAVYIAWGKPSQIVSGGNQSGENVTWLYEGTYLQETRYLGRHGGGYAYSPIAYTRGQVVFVNGVVKEWQTFPSPMPVY